MKRAEKVSIHRLILRQMLSIPTAPFAEHKVVEFIERFCKGRANTVLTRDRAGNILVRIRQGSRKIRRPVCLTAHLDHPGFVAEKMTSRRRVRAHWRGGVPREYFVGSGVRFSVEDRWIKGTVRSVNTTLRQGQRRVDDATIDVPEEIPPGSIGMWDFPDPRIRGRRIYARGCDDLAGAAAMLCSMEQLVRTGKSCDAYFLFTRAEEVGFIGAMAACRLKTVPARCYVVSMETSSQLPSAKMGDGPILRVGDRASTFTPQATAHCHRVARELTAADKSFRYQRKLMDGGTCESSAFCALGYEATGICVALGNYHNVDAARGKLGPEYINLDDFDNVVKWFVELARATSAYAGRDEALHKQLRDLQRTHQRLLRSSLSKPC